jgi:hypothetical protein
MLKVATPELSGPVPKVVEPSLNVTVPVGVPAPGEVTETVAVNVTVCPNTEGLADEETEVEVEAWLTTSDNAEEVLPLKLVSAPYTAVILCVAADRDDVLKVAVPELSVPVPRVVAPSLKVIVPDGVPAPGATTDTVAVNVTD